MIYLDKHILKVAQSCN